MLFVGAGWGCTTKSAGHSATNWGVEKINDLRLRAPRSWGFEFFAVENDGALKYETCHTGENRRATPEQL